MKFMYLILATSGWIWLAVAVVLLWLRMRSLRQRQPGSDGVLKHEH